MSTGPRLNRTHVLSLMSISMVLSLTACQKPGTSFRVTAFSDGGKAELFVENFPDGAFTRNALGNYQLAFELPPRRMAIRPPNEAPEGAAETGDSNDSDEAASPSMVANQPAPVINVPEEVYIAQFVFVELMWHPEPGTTYVESSQTNAGLTYCLVRGGDTVRYEGAGFVYFRLSRDGTSMTGRIESATLYPSDASSSSIDVLGPCRVTADFVALQSGRRVTDVQRRLNAPAGQERVLRHAGSVD